MIEVPNLQEHDDEPVRGLPGPLPQGERLLWQGRPDWRMLARRAFHVQEVAVYFALLMVWRGADMAVGGAGIGESIVAALWLLPVAGLAIGLLGGLAWLSARAAVYTITSRRVVIRGGIAFQIAVNIPYRLVGSAALRLNRDGSGDIPLRIQGKDRVSYLILWPHVRPWRLGRPEPMLRAVPDASLVADILSRALAECHAADGVEVRTASAAPSLQTTGSLSTGAAAAATMSGSNRQRPHLVAVMGSAQA